MIILLNNIKESTKVSLCEILGKTRCRIGDDFKDAFGINAGLTVDVYRELIKYYGGFLNYKKSIDEYVKDKVFEVEPGNRYGGYDFKYKLKISW
jgi:hypothetical protein